MVDIAMAMREAGTVRKATADEAPDVARVLARAFYDDPPTVWVLPDDATRMNLLERGYELYLRRLWLQQEETYTTANGAGACVWERPGEWKVPVPTQLRLLPHVIRIYGRGTARVLRALATLESDHPSEPHYYLPFVGVEPEWQGHGLGAALMRPVLDRCDEGGVPAYLEASSPRNRALYERHGFTVTQEFTLGKGSPPISRMWRAPAA